MNIEAHANQYTEHFGQFEILTSYAQGFKNDRLVSLSKKIMAFDSNIPFTDFLYSFLRNCFGFHLKEDCKVSRCKLCQHQISDWISSYERGYQIAVESENGSFELDGFSNALMRLAFDLLVIDQKLWQQNNGKIDLKFDKTIDIWMDKTLRSDHDFLGVRHELLAAAVMIKSGFDIEFIDESKSPKGQSRPEFIAKLGDLSIAVEAKSRNRETIALAKEPEATLLKKIKVIIKDQLWAAAKKDFGMPTVIFIDLNLPNPNELPLNERKLFKQLKLEINDALGELDPQNFNRVILTNIPDIYIGDQTSGIFSETFSFDAPNPKYKLDQAPLKTIHHYTTKANVIPSELTQIPYIARTEFLANLHN